MRFSPAPLGSNAQAGIGRKAVPAVSARLKFSGERLKQRRVGAGYSREQLAVAISRSWSSVYQLERGHMRPSTETLEQIAAYLDCDPGDLFEEVVDE